MDKTLGSLLLSAAVAAAFGLLSPGTRGAMSREYKLRNPGDRGFGEVST